MSRDRHRETLQSLRMARESRDSYPSIYAAELRTLVGELSDLLGAPSNVRQEALKVASLQDLGLLGVNHSTLAAQRTLSEEEMREVRKAPLVAQSLVASMPGYEIAADAVRHAHERWDGKGYPDGLAGADIPLASRIVAVAAAFQAMGAPRPFRAAMQPAAVRSELKAGAGSQFDPEVVAAMLELERRDDRSRKNPQDQGMTIESHGESTA